MPIMHDWEEHSWGLTRIAATSNLTVGNCTFGISIVSKDINILHFILRAMADTDGNMG